MCQVYGPTAIVGCEKCGAGYYEGSSHTCKVFKAFEQWDKELQGRAAEEYTGTNSLMRTLHRCTENVAGWPEWKRHAAWSEEYQFSVKENTCV